VAPKVASAPRGPVPATLAGNPVQSLPQCPISLANKTQKNGGMKTTNRFLMVPLPFLAPTPPPINIPLYRFDRAATIAQKIVHSWLNYPRR
jgi:hypothetical protein